MLLVFSWALVSHEALAVTVTETQRLTSDPADQYNPVISGDFVVFTDTRLGNADIFLYNIPSGTETNITNDPANQLLNDVRGDFVVYSDYKSGTAQIVVYHIPSATPCQVTFGTHSALYPSLGGELLVYQDQASDSDIGMFDLSVLDTTRFSASCDDLAAGRLQGATVLALGPGRQLSPKTSGKWIVYQGFNAQNEARIYAYDRTNQSIAAMPDRGRMQVLPDIDGARVVYVEDDGSNRDIVSYDLDDHTFIQITSDRYRQSYPAISGNFIAFEDSRAGNLDIYVYDLSTGLLTALTSDPANQYMNSIDGTNVVFTDASATNLDVVRVSFAPEVVEPPEPCKREGSPTPLGEIALDDTSLIVGRELILWPFLSKSFSGGSHLGVSDHHRIAYDLEVAKDEPQALLTLHARLARTSLPSSFVASGLDAQAGVVLKVNGVQRRWDDPAGGPALTLVASKQYAQTSTYSDANVALPERRALLVPREVRVSAGNAANQWMSVHFDTLECRYRGGASQTHPQGFLQRSFGMRYSFQSCSDAHLQPGDTVDADTVSVHVENGDSLDPSGRTEVTLRLYTPDAAGSGQWVDAIFTTAVPLFSGKNRVTLEGPGYGSTYWSYRKVDFAGGGRLSAVGRAACVADPSLLPACSRADAEVLYGPVDVIRRAGSLEAVPFHYETTTPGAAIICVNNGDGEGLQRVTSAVVTHNGEPVLGPRAFGASVAATAASVMANPVNEGTVELQSAPGTYLQLKVVRAPARSGPEPETIALGSCSESGAQMLWWCALPFFLLRRAARRNTGKTPAERL